MSDEEKKAIEHIKNYPINWLIENVNESAIKIILNLIEKQSKEIEEFKEKNIKAGNLLAKRITMYNKAQCELEDHIENKELINQTLGLEKNANINKTLEKIIILNNYEAKIKAKIEELRQEIKDYCYVYECNKGCLDKCKEDCEYYMFIEILQSLLDEKE